MLVLTRESGEQIEFRMGDQIVRMSVVEMRGNRVRLGFEADASVEIDRREVADAKRRERESGEPRPDRFRNGNRGRAPHRAA